MKGRQSGSDISGIEVAAIESRVEQQLMALFTEIFGPWSLSRTQVPRNELLPELWNGITDAVKEEIKETLIAELRAEIAALKKSIGIEGYRPPSNSSAPEAQLEMTREEAIRAEARWIRTRAAVVETIREALAGAEANESTQVIRHVPHL